MESHLHSKHGRLPWLVLLFTTCFRLNGLKLEKSQADVFEVKLLAIRQSCPIFTIRTLMQLHSACVMCFHGLKPAFRGFNLFWNYCVRYRSDPLTNNRQILSLQSKGRVYGSSISHTQSARRHVCQLLLRHSRTQSCICKFQFDRWKVLNKIIASSEMDSLHLWNRMACLSI